MMGQQLVALFALPDQLFIQLARLPAQRPYVECRGDATGEEQQEREQETGGRRPHHDPRQAGGGLLAKERESLGLGILSEEQTHKNAQDTDHAIRDEKAGYLHHLPSSSRTIEVSPRQEPYIIGHERRYVR